MVKRVKRQASITTTTTEAIMRHPEFARGLADIRAGRPFDDREDDGSWHYERGRLFGAIAPLSMLLRIDGTLNPKAVALFDAAYGRKLIL